MHLAWKCCISLYSYIKPQPWHKDINYTLVVYLYIPTSNHNFQCLWRYFEQLYIFIFLHQTTTNSMSMSSQVELYIFIFLHQTTTAGLNSYLGDVLYIFIFLHQTTTRLLQTDSTLELYIFIFLHQTTTVNG